jgi:hypothetical protein
LAAKKSFQHPQAMSHQACAFHSSFAGILSVSGFLANLTHYGTPKVALTRQKQRLLKIPPRGMSRKRPVVARIDSGASVSHAREVDT